MECPELQYGDQLPDPDFSRFIRLHPDGRRLIRSWFDRAKSHISSPPEESFEPFIFAWISFNGWAASVTELDRDRQWIGALSKDNQLINAFSLLAVSDSGPFKAYAESFHRLWPVFEVRAIRRRGLQWHGLKKRSEIVQYYLSNGLTVCEPRCAPRHIEVEESIPLDWPHTLAALYRVRNNLFHGEKAPYSDNDRNMVHSALLVLVSFMDQAEMIFGEEGAG
ncbi:MAG: hypothetical protein IIA89_13820 [Chloroflexi bacterium]|nr:hypothetical protein [Chloroflexota bacterium]